MLKVLIVLVILIGAVVIAGSICYYKLALPNMKPLTEEELSLCKKIVERREGYPWVCKRAVKIGMCGCLPCKKLEREKQLQSTVRN